MNTPETNREPQTRTGSGSTPLTASGSAWLTTGWTACLSLVALALAGSIWAWIVKSSGSCSSCGEANALAGDLDLASAGVAYYALLLSSGILFGPSRFFFFGVSIASAVHFVLIGLLVENQIFCAPCFVTGLSAMSAMVASFAVDRVNLARASTALPAAGLAALVGLHMLGVHAAVERVEETRRQVSLLSESVRAPAPGRARLVAYVRSGCRWCDVLERDVMPRIRRNFGGSVSIETRRAPPGIPTPTIVVSGSQRTVFPGLPETEAIERALELALGRSSP